MLHGQTDVARSDSGTKHTRLADGLEESIRILTCGSVDDGKSTLIGRLLWEASELPDHQRQLVQRAAERSGTPDLLDYTLLLDGLVAEREQGITIDVAWRYVDTARRRLVFIDSPGHEQYTRNMACGASHADVGVMLIDARHGIKRQTLRHAAILDVMGVRRVLLAVNKMDLIDWSEARFNAIADDFHHVAASLGFSEATAIPVSARYGDNIAHHSTAMLWHEGPTLVSYLESVPSRRAAVDAPFRMPVQAVLRDTQDFRGLAGLISTGTIRVGDRVADAASGRSAKVKRIATMGGDLATAAASRSVALVLDTDLDVSRGAVLADPETPPVVASRIEAQLVWLAETEFVARSDLILRTATDQVSTHAIQITARLGLETLEFEPARHCHANDVVVASITLARATALDRFADCHATGSFLLVDPISGETLAAGIVREAQATEIHGKQRPPVFRLTHAMLADGLCSDLGTTETDRRELQRRAREVERLFKMAGVAVELALGTGPEP
ncbi:MAG: GTP-binding protein [Pseudomonadota bacterium]